MPQLDFFFLLNSKEGLVQAKFNLLSILWLFDYYIRAILIFLWRLCHFCWDVVEIDGRLSYTKTITIDIFSSGSSFQFSLDVRLLALSLTYC